MNVEIERRRGARLIVVLQEARQVILVVEPGQEVSSDRRCVPFPEAVIQPLVVGVVEPLLLERPFEIPIDFGNEEEARDLSVDDSQ